VTPGYWPGVRAPALAASIRAEHARRAPPSDSNSDLFAAIVAALQGAGAFAPAAPATLIYAGN
jgi:hypothetical protein